MFANLRWALRTQHFLLLKKKVHLWNKRDHCNSFKIAFYSQFAMSSPTETSLSCPPRTFEFCQGSQLSPTASTQQNSLRNAGQPTPLLFHREINRTPAGISLSGWQSPLLPEPPQPRSSFPCAVGDHHLLGGSAPFCQGCHCRHMPSPLASLFSHSWHLYPHHTISVCLQSKQFSGADKYAVCSWQRAAFLHPGMLCCLQQEAGRDTSCYIPFSWLLKRLILRTFD